MLIRSTVKIRGACVSVRQLWSCNRTAAFRTYNKFRHVSWLDMWLSFFTYFLVPREKVMIVIWWALFWRWLFGYFTNSQNSRQFANFCEFYGQNKKNIVKLYSAFLLESIVSIESFFKKNIRINKIIFE